MSSTETNSANRMSGGRQLGERLSARPAQAVSADQGPDETKEAAAKRPHARDIQSLCVGIERL